MTPQPRLLVCLAVVVTLLVGATSTSAASSGARAWLTTGDRSSLLAGQPPSALGPADPSAPTITVAPGRAYQRIEGLGASITDSSAHPLAHSTDRDAIMRSLFDPHRGLELSYLRQPMGASDFVVGPHDTYDDVPVGQTDFGLRHFSIAHDRAEILPLLRQTLALNPHRKIMATPWSPPAWMKTSDSPIGGRFKDDPRIYDAYAR
jgi:glucosylceramidase